MGESSRRKKERRARATAETGAASTLAPLVRELREALVARARAWVEEQPTDAAAERANAASTALRSLLRLEDDDADVEVPAGDRLGAAFMREIGNSRGLPGSERSGVSISSTVTRFGT
jgi:hypothetical protein